MALLIFTGDGMSTRMDLVALTLSSGSVRPLEYSMSLFSETILFDEKKMFQMS